MPSLGPRFLCAAGGEGHQPPPRAAQRKSPSLRPADLQALAPMQEVGVGPLVLMNMKDVDDFGEAGDRGAVESVVSGPSLV